MYVTKIRSQKIQRQKNLNWLEFLTLSLFLFVYLRRLFSFAVTLQSFAAPFPVWWNRFSILRLRSCSKYIALIRHNSPNRDCVSLVHWMVYMQNFDGMSVSVKFVGNLAFAGHRFFTVLHLCCRRDVGLVALIHARLVIAYTQQYTCESLRNEQQKWTQPNKQTTPPRPNDDPFTWYSSVQYTCYTLCMDWNERERDKSRLSHVGKSVKKTHINRFRLDSVDDDERKKKQYTRW